VNLALFELLLDANCDVNIADKLGWTPLYQAATIGETRKHALCYYLRHGGVMRPLLFVRLSIIL